jgi:hypothetical protein
MIPLSFFYEIVTQEQLLDVRNALLSAVDGTPISVPYIFMHAYYIQSNLY